MLRYGNGYGQKSVFLKPLTTLFSIIALLERARVIKRVAEKLNIMRFSIVFVVDTTYIRVNCIRSSWCFEWLHHQKMRF
jgi:hypothetical protein